MSATSRTNALTALAPLAPRRLWWCRIVLPVIRILATSSALARLRSIHFGGWIVFGDLPGATPRGWRSRPSMLFLSNYDGDLAEYLAAFGLAVAPGMRWSFGSAEGFPGTKPTRRFIDYVERFRTVELLRYSAYPASTVRDVDAALAVSARIGELRALGDRADDVRFTAAYRRLLDALALAPEPAVPSFWAGLWQMRKRSTVSGMVAVVPVALGRRDELRSAVAAIAAEAPSPFEQVPEVHFARAAILPVEQRRPSRLDGLRSVYSGIAEPRRPSTQNEFLLFAAWVDGDVDSVVARLTATLGDHADALWGCCAGYPGAGDPAALARWIVGHRLRFSLFVGCRSGVSTGEVRAALELRDRAAEVVGAVQGRPLAEIRSELQELWA